MTAAAAVAFHMLLRQKVLSLREQIVQVAAANGARNIRLFGSAARGADNEQSDVDLLVSLEPGRTLMDLARIEIGLEALLGRSVDVVPESGLREPIRSRVLRQAVNV